MKDRVRYRANQMFVERGIERLQVTGGETKVKEETRRRSRIIITFQGHSNRMMSLKRYIHTSALLVPKTSSLTVT